MTKKEAQKGLECADLLAMNIKKWSDAPKYVRKAYQSLVRLFYEYGAKI